MQQEQNTANRDFDSAVAIDNMPFRNVERVTDSEQIRLRAPVSPPHPERSHKGKRPRNNSVVTFEECEKESSKRKSSASLLHSYKSLRPNSNLDSSISTLNHPMGNQDKSSTSDSDDKRRARKDLAGSRLFSIRSESCTIDEEILAAKKNKSIWCLRSLTTFALVAAAVTVAFLTFSYSRSAELKQFREIYFDSVVKVEEAIAAGIKNKLNTAETFSALYTSRYTNDDWPNVTMPSYEFEAQAKGQLEIANGIALSFNPVINGKNREAFEAHAAAYADILGAEELSTRSCNDTSGSTCRVVADGIFRKAPSPSGDGSLININDPGKSPESRYPYTMVPVWQIFPTEVNWRAVMFNLHSETNRQHALDDMLEYKVPAITALLHLVQHKEMNPSSILFYPVFNRLNNERSSNFTRPPRQIVGSISIVFTWEDILRKVLPAYIEGMIVVLESSVSGDVDRQLWTYDVSGETVTLMGEGDLHDPRFDEFEHGVQASVAREEIELGIVDFLIAYKILIYPSSRFEGKYLSRKPAVMTAIVICIFVLTSLIFLAYDYLLNNRQNAIMSFATKSGRIVESMFPANVRERVINSEHMNKHLHPELNNENCEIPDPLNIDKVCSDKKKTFEKIRFFMNKGRRESEEIRDVTNSLCSSSDSKISGNFNSPPIADYFNETSVMFADIVGFTEWSSRHSPEDVFRLLESLFLEFDRAAARMNVFKLGTIGDCYVAVTGIPDQNPDHGVVMCKFAEECRLKMHDVFDELRHILEGVTNLSMRFGIHSGPVTAGVLRGDKSRFELFGDTINTASRMESLGSPDKIQISQQTANSLIQRGCERCVVPRDRLIHAKGKGELQTYWFSMDNGLPMSGEGMLDLEDPQQSECLSSSSSSSSIFVIKNGI